MSFYCRKVFIAPPVAQWVKNSTVAAWVAAEAWGSIPGLVQYIKGLGFAAAVVQI